MSTSVEPFGRRADSGITSERPEAFRLARAKLRKLGIAAREAAYTLLAMGSAGSAAFCGVTMLASAQQAVASPAGLAERLAVEPQGDVGETLLSHIETGKPITYAAVSIMVDMDGTKFCVTNPAVVTDADGVPYLVGFGRYDKLNPESTMAIPLGPATPNTLETTLDSKVLWSDASGSYVAEHGEPVSRGELANPDDDC